MCASRAHLAYAHGVVRAKPRNRGGALAAAKAGRSASSAGAGAARAVLTANEVACVSIWLGDVVDQVVRQDKDTRARARGSVRLGW